MPFRHCHLLLPYLLLGCSLSSGADSSTSSAPASAGAANPVAALAVRQPLASVAGPKHEPAAPPPLLAPSPPGRWRQARRADLERLVLWPSHLLVRYAGARDTENVSFTMAGFHSVPPPPSRTREQALALAQRLAQQARAEPARFAALVRQHSEDIVRQKAGGSFGGVPAARFAPWPEVLDALLALKPGEVSEPVETWYGFHVFTRRAPPEPDTVTGRRIVVGHSQAEWLGTLDGAEAPTRSRDAAWQHAQAIYEEAKASPDQFSRLVMQHSELRDRVLGGDFGTWSNREPCPFPAEVEVLDSLEAGVVAPPFDSLFGIQVIQRVPNRPRPEYALDGVALPFKVGVPEADPGSRSNVLITARSLAQRLREAPSLLPELQRRYSPIAAQWVDGRGSPEVSLAVAATPLGELLEEPVRSAQKYWVGRRVQPVEKAPIEPWFELPEN